MEMGLCPGPVSEFYFFNRKVELDNVPIART